MKTKKQIAAYFGHAGIPCSTSYILNHKYISGVLLLQFTQKARGGWVPDHDDDEFLIYNIRNAYAEIDDTIKATSITQAVKKLRAYLKQERTKS